MHVAKDRDLDIQSLYASQLTRRLAMACLVGARHLTKKKLCDMMDDDDR